jgi:hypothetical protein
MGPSLDMPEGGKGDNQWPTRLQAEREGNERQRHRFFFSLFIKIYKKRAASAKKKPSSETFLKRHFFFSCWGIQALKA